MKKNTIVSVTLCATLFFALMALGTFFDLDLSKALYYKGSVFGRFFTAFGYAPAYLGVAISALIVFRAVGKNNKFYKWLKPLCVMLFLGASYLLAWWFADEFFPADSINYLYAAVLSLAFFGVGLFATRKIDKGIFDKLLLPVCVFLLASVVAQGVSELLKYLWSRQAYATLSVASNLPGTEGYTPWYLPNLGKNNADYLVYDGETAEYFYRAFPSGSAAAFASLFALTLVPELFVGAKKYLGYFYAVPAALIVLTSFAGIVAGREYLTDVTMGAFIGIGSVFLTKYLLKILWEKKKLPGYDSLAEEEAA